MKTDHPAPIPPPTVKNISTPPNLDTELSTKAPLAPEPEVKEVHQVTPSDRATAARNGERDPALLVHQERGRDFREGVTDRATGQNVPASALPLHQNVGGRTVGGVPLIPGTEIVKGGPTQQ